MPKLQQNSQGFSIGAIIALILVSSVVYGGYMFVKRMNADNKQQASKIQDGLNDENDTVEGAEDEEIPDLRPGTTEKPIKEVEVRIEPYTVTLYVTLPGTYSGQCVSEVEQPGGGGYRRFVAELDKAKVCQIHIPTAGLTAGKTWEYTVKFNNTEDTVRGSYPTASFTLP